MSLSRSGAPHTGLPSENFIEAAVASHVFVAFITPDYLNLVRSQDPMRELCMRLNSNYHASVLIVLLEDVTWEKVRDGVQKLCEISSAFDFAKLEPRLQHVQQSSIGKVVTAAMELWDEVMDGRPRDAGSAESERFLTAPTRLRQTIYRKPCVYIASEKCPSEDCQQQANWKTVIGALCEDEYDIVDGLQDCNAACFLLCEHTDPGMLTAMQERASVYNAGLLEEEDNHAKMQSDKEAEFEAAMKRLTSRTSENPKEDRKWLGYHADKTPAKIRITRFKLIPVTRASLSTYREKLHPAVAEWCNSDAAPTYISGYKGSTWVRRDIWRALADRSKP